MNDINTKKITNIFGNIISSIENIEVKKQHVRFKIEINIRDGVIGENIKLEPCQTIKV